MSLGALAGSKSPHIIPPNSADEVEGIMCSEELTSVSQLEIEADPYFYKNDVILSDLLKDEKRYYCTPAYCQNESNSRGLWMRKTLLLWLRDVCEHRHTDAEVLTHTVHLIDRYLHLANVMKIEYQLVGATCLLIASKLKETTPIAVETVVQYTDYSVKKLDVLNMEILICNTLNYDLTSVTAIDFVGPLLTHLDFDRVLKRLIRSSAIDLFVRILPEESATRWLPSYMAAACVLHSCKESLASSSASVIPQIQRLLSLDARQMRECYEALQACLTSPQQDTGSNVSYDGANSSSESEQKTPTDADDALIHLS